MIYARLPDTVKKKYAILSTLEQMASCYVPIAAFEVRYT